MRASQLHAFSSECACSRGATRCVAARAGNLLEHRVARRGRVQDRALVAWCSRPALASASRVGLRDACLQGSGRSGSKRWRCNEQRRPGTLQHRLLRGLRQRGPLQRQLRRRLQATLPPWQHSMGWMCSSCWLACPQGGSPGTPSRWPRQQQQPRQQPQRRQQRPLRALPRRPPSRLCLWRRWRRRLRRAWPASSSTRWTLQTWSMACPRGTATATTTARTTASEAARHLAARVPPCPGCLGSPLRHPFCYAKCVSFLAECAVAICYIC